MFLLWGSRTRTRRVGQGVFHCPRCRTHVTYSHDVSENWFTLYFIPLFPTRTLGECVRCGECRGAYKPSILLRSEEEIERSMRPWRCSDCACLNPQVETRCLNCQLLRIESVDEEFERPLPISPRNQDGIQDGPPKGPRRIETRNETPDLSAIFTANKFRACRGCGVINAHVAARCKGCGLTLDPA
jgi:zinc-ribbon family